MGGLSASHIALFTTFATIVHLVGFNLIVNYGCHGMVNTLRPRQNGRHFASGTFKSIFMNENVWNWNKISLKLVPKGQIDNIPPLVQIMAWRRPGAKPLSEPMIARLLTHNCVTRPEWVNIPWCCFVAFDCARICWHIQIGHPGGIIFLWYLFSYSKRPWHFCIIYLVVTVNVYSNKGYILYTWQPRKKQHAAAMQSISNETIT